MLQLSQYFCSEQTYSISDLQLKIVGFEVGAVAGVSWPLFQRQTMTMNDVKDKPKAQNPKPKTKWKSKRIKLWLLTFNAHISLAPIWIPVDRRALFEKCLWRGWWLSPAKRLIWSQRDCSTYIRICHQTNGSCLLYLYLQLCIWICEFVCQFWVGHLMLWTNIFSTFTDCTKAAGKLRSTPFRFL